MIKMNYGDAKHLTQLKEGYPKIFKGVSRMQSRWAALRKKLVKKDAEFKRLLPAKVDELLVMDFEGLADIYEKYIGQVLEEEIVDDAKSLFAYERHKDRYDVTWTGLRSKIVEFMLDKKNGFDIHTCHYCDMAYINVFEVGKKKKTQFDLDHVLDKGRCPILALSLFNFVPSCQVCNGQRIKGSRLLYPDARLRKKLSPTNLNYDFEGKVKIEVKNKKGECSTIGFEKRMDDYEIKLDTHLDPDYNEEVKAFHLKERYEYHKCEALRMLDLKERYSDARILEMARMIAGGSKEKMTLLGAGYLALLKKDVFAKEFRKKFHRSFGKMYDDVMG